MTAEVLVIGSGASGVAFATRLIEAGRSVLMIDVGRRGEKAPFPTLDLPGLKSALPDPRPYFLGARNEALILPEEDEDEYYGIPPGKSHVFSPHRRLPFESRGFEPLFSFAAGGLAEAWTGGSYPFNAAEIADWPFDFEELLPQYSAIARQIGVSGAVDDLSSVMPVHEGLLPTVELDEHASRLLKNYEKKRASFAKRKILFGRARLALLSEDRGDRQACDFLGRCLWGCPRGSLYTPALGLDALIGRPGFEYRSGHFVERFIASDGGQITEVISQDNEGHEHRHLAHQVVLAAGTLASARIYLASLDALGLKNHELTGLLDNRQLLMPFVNLEMLGKKPDLRSYQYHQLAFGLDQGGPMDYVHGLVTTLKTAMLHPVIQSLPFSMGTSTRFFGEMHAALGLLNINFSDQARAGNRVTLEVMKGGEAPRLLIDYQPDDSEPARLKKTAKIFRKALWSLGALAPKPMTHLRPMGASVHYAGTLPMSRSGPEDSLDAEGRSRRFSNLYFVDGSGFPSLPAKNLTFTLMANARRIAERSFCS